MVIETKTPTCSYCLTPLQPINEEVDIGVGLQKFLTGYHCPGCERDFAVCSQCGALEPHECQVIEIADADDAEAHFQ